jgi:prepilin-type processing-associated H-X9-DG protein
VSGLLTGSGTTNILFVDSSTPKQSGSLAITCP